MTWIYNSPFGISGKDLKAKRKQTHFLGKKRTVPLKKRRHKRNHFHEVREL